MYASERETHLVFIDIKKAYDAVPLALLFETFDLMETPAINIKEIKQRQIFKNVFKCKTKIEIKYVFSKSFM